MDGFLVNILLRVQLSIMKQEKWNYPLATELDIHINSPVVGQNSWIIDKTDKSITVKGFIYELGEIMKVPVVHMSIISDQHITGNSYVLVIRNTLHICTMKATENHH